MYYGLLFPVWCVSWHTCGDFLASCSMDNTGKVWDLNSLRCRYTLRGHTDSVNSIEFLPFSNTLLSCSADKTLSLWDARTVRFSLPLYQRIFELSNLKAFVDNEINVTQKVTFEIRKDRKLFWKTIQNLV